MNSHLSSFISARRDGALVGPFPPMLHFPEFGKAAWRNVEALIDNAKLPKTAHEVAILATRAAFGSRCELYAHARVAKGVGLTPSKMVSWLLRRRGPCSWIAPRLGWTRGVRPPIWLARQDIAAWMLRSLAGWLARTKSAGAERSLFYSAAAAVAS